MWTIETYSYDKFGNIIQLLRSMDHGKQLDQLDCAKCFKPFNDTNKKPVIKCSDNGCAYVRVLCQQCLKDHIKAQEDKIQNYLNNMPQGQDPQQQSVKCYFCSLTFNNTIAWGYHQSRLEFIKKLNKLIESMRQINIKAIKQNEKQYDKKINDIVENADKEIFKINIENQQKQFLLNRMKKRMNSFQAQTDNKAKQLQQQQKIISQRQKTVNKLHQQIIDNQIQLQHKLKLKQQKIKSLTIKKQKLQQKLNKKLQLQNIDQRIRRNNPNGQLVDNQGYYYNPIKFRPYQNSKFIANFRKVNNVIQLKKERKEQLIRSSGDNKYLYHHHHMINGKEDRLVCFTMTSINKNVSQYKFGLAVEDIDSNYRQVKGASLSVDVSGYVQKEGLQQFDITFYVNLNNMRLYASCGSFRSFSNLPTNVQLKKYTFYVYFTHLQTKIKFP